MTINLSPWQTTVWNDPTRYIVVNCGRRAGKTTVVALKLIDFASKNPKSVCWYVAPDYKQAKQILWEMLKQLIPERAIGRRNDTDLIVTLTNGSKIMLKGAQDPDSLRGVKIDMCVFDECAFMDRWDEVWKVIRPTLADSQARVWFISTPNGFNHFKEMADRTDPQWSYHHYTSYDNSFLPREEIDQMKEEMDEDSFAQEIMGEFRKMSGLIYKEFNRATHMRDLPKFLPGWSYYRAIDFGFGHKMALGYFAVNPQGTEVWLYDGVYQSGMTTSEIGDAVKLKDTSKFITGAWADSADPQSIEELTRAGINFTPVTKGPDSVQQGIRDVAGLLKIRNDTGNPTLMISKELGWVADEFERYRWIQNKNMNSGQKEMPLKREDDAMDMIRYFARMYMPRGNKARFMKPKDMLQRKRKYA